MPYYVTKTIKGRPYLYLQWSWREGGKVKTENLYIAPVDAATGTVELPDTKTVKNVYAEIRESFLNGRNITPPSSDDIPLSRQSQKPPPPETLPPFPDKFTPSEAKPRKLQTPEKTPARSSFPSDSAALTLHARVHFDELKVSPHSIEQRHLKHEQILNDAGMNPNDAPAISMTHGIRHKVRLFRRQNVIVVRVPRRGKGAANGLRKSFSRAMALSKLRTLQVQKPNAFEALTLQGKTAQSATKIELRKFLLNTNGRHRRTKALAVKLFGKIDPIRKGRNGKLPASHLGLSDYGNRLDWFEDTTLLLMEIEQHKGGYGGVLNDAKTELRKSKGTLAKSSKQGFSVEKLFTDERMTWGFARRREIRRAEARAALQQIRIERLNNLRAAFHL